jgi:hypothetical protein
MLRKYNDAPEERTVSVVGTMEGRRESACTGTPSVAVPIAPASSRSGSSYDEGTQGLRVEDETISVRVLPQIRSGRCVGSQSLGLAKVGEANGGSPAEKGTDDILLWRRHVIDRTCRHFVRQQNPRSARVSFDRPLRVHGHIQKTVH